MNKKSIKDIDVKSKRVLVRVDFNVPLDKELNITDDKRIVASLDTIKYLIDNGAKVILMSHLGRPKGQRIPEFSLKPVADRLTHLLGKPVKILDDCIGEQVLEEVKKLEDKEVILLENLRFHKEETKNDPNFSKALASLGEIFVNDAFGTCHRAHSSTEGVTHQLSSVAGFLVEKEIKYFQEGLTQPKKPFLFILGGAKVADKIPVIENMIDKADSIIIGGAMAYTFMKVKGTDVGSSRLEKDMFDTARNIFAKVQEKGIDLVLPIDHVVTDSIEEPTSIKITEGPSIDDGFIGVDIGPKTQQLFGSKIKEARTIVWNGPVGIFENDKFCAGTKQIALDVSEAPATSIIGGGDTAAAVAKFSLADKMSHISTGGGASLEYLEGKVLPGIAALEDK